MPNETYETKSSFRVVAALSPAKINIGLQVYHRRAKDGLHYLHGIFAPISFGDSMLIEQAEKDEIITENLLREPSYSDFEKVSERAQIKDNLLHRALILLRESFPQRPAIRIQLQKRVPTGAGLGGGSSNVGMLLRYARDRMGLQADLIEGMAARLGSDVSFFLGSGPALVGGIGESIQAISLGSGYGVLCLPGVRVDTGAAYECLKRPLQEALPAQSWLLLGAQEKEALISSHWRVLESLRNDFEEPVLSRHPILAGFKEAFITAGAAFCSLSGSGSALYALADSAEAQRQLLGRMRAKFPETQFEDFELRTEI